MTFSNQNVFLNLLHFLPSLQMGGGGGAELSSKQEIIQIENIHLKVPLNVLPDHQAMRPYTFNI